MMSDEIFLKDPPKYGDPPQEPASDPNYIKHVWLDGARFHVLRYSSRGTHCSEQKCIMNKWDAD